MFVPINRGKTVFSRWLPDSYSNIGPCLPCTCTYAQHSKRYSADEHTQGLHTGFASRVRYRNEHRQWPLLRSHGNTAIFILSSGLHIRSDKYGLLPSTGDTLGSLAPKPACIQKTPLNGSAGDSRASSVRLDSIAGSRFDEYLIENT